MQSSSSASGGPICMPLAYSRTVPPPRREATLGVTPVVAIASSQSPKRRHPLALSRHSGTASTMASERSGSSIRPPKGAGVHASPMISVVTPCVTLERQRPSRIRGRIEWLRMSTKPGQTAIPEPSTTSRARPAEMLPAGRTSRTFSPARATSPWNQGLPVPSTTLAPRINTSTLVSGIRTGRVPCAHEPDAAATGFAAALRLWCRPGGAYGRQRGEALEPRVPPQLLRARHHRAAGHHAHGGAAVAVRPSPRGRGAELPHHHVPGGCRRRPPDPGRDRDHPAATGARHGRRVCGDRQRLVLPGPAVSLSVQRAADLVVSLHGHPLIACTRVGG